ncbi:MAG TPA: hypothetical protein VJ917_08225 [Saprospiraceae bacterium]|nr:hypothetical protein [Saprospiraceae bacterium]
MKKSIIYLAVGLILAIVIYAFYEYNRGPASLDGKSSDMSISAKELLKDFQQDEKLANSKYLDKVILVTGAIAELKKDEVPPSVILETGDALSRVVCEMERLPDALSLGEAVSIKAKCTGFLMDVVLVQGVIAE